jgi:hypothetical protein
MAFILRYTPDGQLKDRFGGPEVGFYQPRGMDADASGNIFMTDRFNYRVRRVDAATGIIATVAGTGTAGFSGDGGPGTVAQVDDLHGTLGLDGAGNLYIPDTGNNRIRKLDTSGAITTIAGTGSAGYSGDGGPATSARLNQPRGAALDPAGNLYIADTTNDVIRHVESAALPAGDPPPADGDPMPTPQPSPQSSPQPPQPSPQAIVQPQRRSGYWMVSATGNVYSFGAAANLGGDPSDAVDIEPTPSGAGYWILDRWGHVFAKGDAQHLGRAALGPGETAVALSATPTGNGYWIFTDKGRVIALGGARFTGDMSATMLNGPVLDAVATPSGNGYWMVASDGGIFAFGDAAFFGSMGGQRLNKPVMSMAPDPDGVGYWLVASDGGIFAFAATFHGSMGGTPLNKPVSGMVPGAAGYLMVAEDGGIFAFGDVAFHGSLGASPPVSPIVAVALRKV